MVRSRDFERGFFCAVSALLREHGGRLTMLAGSGWIYDGVKMHFGRPQESYADRTIRGLISRGLLAQAGDNEVRIV